MFNSLIFNPRGCSLQRTVGSDPGLTQKRCLKMKQHQIISNPTTYGFCMNMKIWGYQFGRARIWCHFVCTSQNACKYSEIYTRCSKLRHLSISLQMANAFWCIRKIHLPDFRASWKDPLPNIYENTALSGAPSLPPVPVVFRAPELSLRSRPAQVSLRLLEKLRKVHPHIMSFLRVVLLWEFSLLNAQITMESCVAIDT